MRIVLVMERLMAATGHLLRGHDGKLSSAVLHAVTFEFAFDLSPSVHQARHFRVQLLTNDGHMVYPRHGDVQVGKPHACSLFPKTSTLPHHRLGQTSAG